MNINELHSRSELEKAAQYSRLEEAARQALERMELWKDVFPEDWDDLDEEAITTLRTAIEQAEKPSTRPATREEKIVNPGVYEVPVQSAERVEPVAWRYTDARGHYRYRGYRPSFDVEYPLLKPQALYTTPPAAQPAPVQEPVEYWNAVEGWVKIDEVRQHFDSVGCGTIYKNAGEDRVPLYTAAQRQWVGLTDEEMEKISVENGMATFLNDGEETHILWFDGDCFALLKAAEAKLKEKNGF